MVTRNFAGVAGCLSQEKFMAWDPSVLCYNLLPSPALRHLYEVPDAISSLPKELFKEHLHAASAPHPGPSEPLSLLFPFISTILISSTLWQADRAINSLLPHRLCSLGAQCRWHRPQQPALLLWGESVLCFAQIGFSNAFLL